jgi:hypothetical protein
MYAYGSLVQAATAEALTMLRGSPMLVAAMTMYPFTGIVQVLLSEGFGGWHDITEQVVVG